MALEIPKHPSVDTTSAAGIAADEDPLWYKDAVIYQAHVKAFFDSNNDGVGDFTGLTQKLDYLEGLGVTCLWLLPFYPSPLKDDGYDISDYRNVHPSYGTLEDFRAFVEAAHERHIKILIELVINHTSDQHPWFQRARHAPPGSPERDFYVWNDTDRKFPDTRIIFSDTEKSNWTYDPVAGQYYWHRFFSHQPDLNLNNPAVVDAVIEVMKFWLDLGVDALRLDAVPYLCVREGTSNENLPETHGVLKRMRRELDAAYKNRMLLAEANQWPSDVRAYFGDGDECHMAFHFPLMPRMFMAIQQEDRHAITEILNQTPDIPDTCQWALFLRNHDELTLEMVTDEERDYMYSVYAADPQMRLNGGIRRRLAPLLEGSRRRMELMTSLLFAFPGTPILYYGDEIGMGDNIYLGDRNGVRTPMQWSSDRNGGFSRADPARLYAPPIMDPVYGFQAINVEAQERYPFSLLHWMKRLIAMRRQHRSLGRGSLDIIYGPNRKVLSFLRRDAQETILVVANLSRSVQPTALDLHAFSGLIPVEMWGLAEFPRISEQPYVLTLGPYASYWFTLRPDPMQLSEKGKTAPDSAAAVAESLPALLAGADWQQLLDGSMRTVLERQALRPFLERQQWFDARTREIRRARFVDWVRLAAGIEPTFLTIVAVQYADGTVEQHAVPLALLSGPRAERALTEAPATVLARMTGARKGAIVDGMSDDGTCERLLAMVMNTEEVPASLGGVRGSVYAAASAAAAIAPGKWTRHAGDGNNSVVSVDERYVLKLIRRLEQGPHPELEVERALTERGFLRAPALLGSLDYQQPGAEPTTMALVQTHVTHQGSGWDYTVNEVRRYFERVSTQPPPPDEAMQDDPPPFVLAFQRWYLRSVGVLGRRTAELHLALAETPGSGFIPEALDATTLGALADEMRAHAAVTLDLLQSGQSKLQEAAGLQAATLLAARERLLALFDEIREIKDPGQRIRIHGDYHLGQVLRVEEDFVILDFEGEAGRLQHERRAKQSPLKDVAGMVRSFSYAASATLLSFTIHSPDTYAAIDPWSAAWQRWISDAFIQEYRATLSDSPVVPSGEAFTRLLRAFALDKALHELASELYHRPEWIRIPLTGLLKIVS